MNQLLTFHWVIAAFQCYKLFDRGQLAVALHYTEFQAISCPPPEISIAQRASLTSRMDAPTDIHATMTERHI